MGLLDGITVLDLSSVGPASRATGWLADYGAEVVKVQPVEAGTATTPPPHAYAGGRGTRRMRVNIKDDRGREVFLRVAAGSDVVIESFRPGVVARLGIGYDDVKSRNPRIVYCSTSGYGQDGPRAQWAGHDINYLAVGGFLANSERGAGNKPPLPGATVADSAAGGMQAVIAILAALVARDATGEGCYLDVSVAAGVVALMGLQADDHLATGAQHSPGSAPLGGRFACYDIYAAADGKWLAVGAIEPKFWANLCRLLERTELIPLQYDDGAQPALRTSLAKVFATKTADEWIELLAGADTCVTPVLTVAEATASVPTVPATHPLAGPMRQLAPLLAGQVGLPSYELPDPDRTDTEAVLLRAGFGADEIAGLREAGVVA